MKLTKSRIREARSLIGQAGYKYEQKEISERIYLEGENNRFADSPRSLNYELWPEGDHDLSDIGAPENWAGEEIEEKDGCVCLDFWIYAKNGRTWEYRDLIDHVQVYFYNLGNGRYVSSLKPFDAAARLRAQVKDKGARV